MPVAIIENGTLASQRIFTGRLDQIEKLLTTNAVGAPALLIIGDVVAQGHISKIAKEPQVLAVAS